MPSNKLSQFKLERMKKFIRNNPDVLRPDIASMFDISVKTVDKISQLIKKEKEDERNYNDRNNK
jgi:hypothetical protein